MKNFVVTLTIDVSAISKDDAKNRVLILFDTFDKIDRVSGCAVRKVEEEPFIDH